MYREAILYIQLGTPRDLARSCDLALPPPFGQTSHHPYGPRLLETHTNTYSAHSMTYGVLSNFIKLYVQHQEHPRHETPVADTL
jgi:hypothetical protein